MRYLVVREPWASMIANGQKSVEVRSWRTTYRGPVTICVAKRNGGELGGKTLCVVELADVRPFEPSDIAAARATPDAPSFAWVLHNVRRVAPTPVVGRLGLFTTSQP